MASIDERFESYVNLYNNIDTIMWQFPAYLITAITIIAAVLVGVLAYNANDYNANAYIKPTLVLLSWIGAAILFAISFISGIVMIRIKKQHDAVCDALGKMEEPLQQTAPKYFAKRTTPNGKKNIGAPHMFAGLFFAFAASVFVSAIWLGFL